MALITGDCLAIFFGMTNNHGVVRSTIQRAAAPAAPDPVVLRTELNALFTGELVKLSYQLAILPEAEKRAHNVCIAPYTRRSVNGTVRNNTRPDIAYGFRLEGLGAFVGEEEVSAFMIANAKMPNGLPVTDVFVNAFRKMA